MLTHLMLADKFRLRRFAGQGMVFSALTPTLLQLPEGTDYTSDLHPDRADLRRTREALDAGTETWLAGTPADFPLAIMRYGNTKGVASQHPAWQALSHSATSSTTRRTTGARSRRCWRRPV